MIKIHTFYDATVGKPEYNGSPSKTDASFYEPLNVLVQKIIRGERVKMSSLDSYEFSDVGKISDEVFDGPASDAQLDDFVDLDFFKESALKQTFPKNAEPTRANEAPSKASASERGEVLKEESFVEKSAT